MLFAQSNLSFDPSTLKDAKYLQNVDIYQIVSNFLDLLLIFVVIASVFYLVIAGLKYIMSGGDQAKTKEAQSAIFNVIVGLIIAVSAYFLVQFVLKQLGIDISQLGMFSRTTQESPSPTPTPTVSVTPQAGAQSVVVAYVKNDGIYTNTTKGAAEQRVIQINDAFKKVPALSWKNQDQLSYVNCDAKCKVLTYTITDKSTKTEAEISLVQKIALDWSPKKDRLGFLTLDVFGDTVAGYFTDDGQKNVLMTYPNTSPREEVVTDRFDLSYSPSGKYVMYITTFADSLTSHESVSIFDNEGSKVAKHTYPILEGAFLSEEVYVVTGDKKVSEITIASKQSKEVATNDERLYLSASVFEESSYSFTSVNTSQKQTALHFSTKNSVKKVTDHAHSGRFSSSTNIVAYSTDSDATKKYPFQNKGLVSISTVNGETTTITKDTITEFDIREN
jgi:hypothetical protein